MQHRERDVLLDRKIAAEAAGVAILRHVRDTASRARDRRDRTGASLPLTEMRPAARRALSDDRLREFGLARSREPGEADPLPASHLDRDVAHQRRRPTTESTSSTIGRLIATSRSPALASSSCCSRPRRSGARRRVLTDHRRHELRPGRDRRPPPRRRGGRRASPRPARRSRRSPADGGR